MSQPSRPVARAAWLPTLTADGWLLFATGGVRNFAYGFLSVVLALYLAALGLDPNAIGVIFAAALAGGAVVTIAALGGADPARGSPALVGGGGPNGAAGGGGGAAGSAAALGP